MNRYRGMTLVEIMVAVGITVGMLLLIGNVFKSATDSSGSALALNDVNGQMRVVTEQLQSDFAGFQKDLPFAIIFQAHRDDGIDPYPELGDPDEPGKLIRYDRICFFANGDFQDIYGSNLSGNLARIFYGQMLDSPPLTIDNDVSAPRQILSRRQKIMTTSPDKNMFPAGVSWGALDPVDYDFQPFEFTPISTNPLNLTPGSPTSFWKNVPILDYVNAYFNDLAIESFVRRPNYNELSAAPAALQQLQMLSDVTDFKIQIYLYDNSPTQQRWRWFPDDQDFPLMANLVGAANPLLPFAFYWNVPDLDTANPFYDIGPIRWFGENDVVFAGFFWPKAIRFTFTLYDKNRRRFGEGQTFSYIVKIPQRY